MFSIELLGRARAARHTRGMGLGASLIALGLTACAPDLGQAPQITPALSYATTRSFTGPLADWPTDLWWTAYGDPQLDALIAEALKGSPDLKAAAARVRLAQSQTELAGDTRLPSISGDAGIQTTKQSLNEGYPADFKPLLPAGYHTQTRIAATLDYQLDFFGRNRAALAAATSAEEAARADEASARLQLSTAVASAYADLLRLYADRDAAVDAVRVRGATLDLVGQRLRNGLDTRGTFSQEQETVPQARGDVVAIDRQIAATRNQIAALLGEGPDRGLAISRPAEPKLSAFGLPDKLQVDLVGRRPDIVAARLRAESAAKQIKVARADFYPNIDLSATYGTQSLGINTLLQYDSVIGAIGPAIHLPIFTAGRLESAYRGARANYDAAVDSYDQTLTNALRDVADVIANQHALEAQIADARAAAVSAEDAFNIAKLRYSGGLSPYLNVLTAENSFLLARRNLADFQAQALSLNIALVRALGGGFVADARLAAR
jgi:NodT family efflux transporter outer membrane factor (OMF) lipoprotein